MEGEGVTPAYMALAQKKFVLQLAEYKGNAALKQELLNAILENNMGPYYKETCSDLSWPFDENLYQTMVQKNKDHIAALEKEHHERAVLDDDDQVSALWKAKLDYLCSVGDKAEAIELAESKLNDKTVPKTHRIDAAFALFRIAYFHNCVVKEMTAAIEKARDLIESSGGGDWSARNKLKAYEAIWSLSIRDYQKAANLFVDVVPTFESYELATFSTIIKYTVISCMVALPRSELKSKLLQHGVMAQALHSPQHKPLKDYVTSLYDGRYADLLVSLAQIEEDMFKDPLLHAHFRHYTQEMRVRGYKQMLEAYRSLSLDYMASSFGVSAEFVEREVARFASSGRLHCKIDSVNGTVVTSHPGEDDSQRHRGLLYKATVRRGDILLNRLKKLARVMDF